METKRPPFVFLVKNWGYGVRGLSFFHLTVYMVLKFLFAIHFRSLHVEASITDSHMMNEDLLVSSTNLTTIFYVVVIGQGSSNNE